MPLGLNSLLAALEARDLELLEDRLREVQLGLRSVLFQPGDTIDCVYFPLTAIIAQQVVNDRGQATAAAMVCNNGLVGLGACLAGGTSFTRHVVLMHGTACCLDRHALLAAMGESTRLRELLAGCTDALTAEAMQSAACVAKHTLEERLARLLLTCLDSGQDELTIAEDVFSTVLVAHRRQLTLAARTLQSHGILRYRDGVFTGLDRAGLQEVSCECYDAVRLRHSRRVSALR